MKVACLWMSIIATAVIACPFTATAQITLRRELLEKLSRNRASIVKQTSRSQSEAVRSVARMTIGQREIVTSVDTLAAPTRSSHNLELLALPIIGVAPVKGVAREFRVVVDPGSGLRYDHTSSLFRGRIHIGLEGIEPEEAAFAGGLVLQIFGPEEVEPDQLVLDHLGVPFYAVKVASRTSDSVRVRVRPRDQQAITFSIPIVPVPLQLSASSLRVGGLGVDALTLTVPFPAAYDGDTLTITLEGDGVSAQPSFVRVSRAGPPATAIIRSVGLGKRRVVARGPAFTAAAVVDLEFGLPGAFLLFALSGGAVGAVAREALRKDVPAMFARFAIATAIGALVGLIVTALFVNGVSLLGLALAIGSSEIVVFAIATIAGLGGVALLAHTIPALGAVFTPSSAD